MIQNYRALQESNKQKKKRILVKLKKKQVLKGEFTFTSFRVNIYESSIVFQSTISKGPGPGFLAFKTMPFALM